MQAVSKKRYHSPSQIQAAPKQKFAEITTRTELAERLNCDKKALEYVVMVTPRAVCKKRLSVPLSRKKQQILRVLQPHLVSEQTNEQKWKLLCWQRLSSSWP